MMVPQFWAEGIIKERLNGREVTVRRFGWSDDSQADAQLNADTRAREAFDRLAAGEKIIRREPKLPYNGAEGVPIREEIVSRHGETVITRNIYGARCLNTPNVLFIDIDFENAPAPWWLTLSSICFFLFCAAAAGCALRSLSLALTLGLLALFCGYLVASALTRLFLNQSGKAEQRARNRIGEFVRGHPGWHLRLYRTPAGLRVLVMHRTFDPGEPAVVECFQALGADPMYVRMCANQRCFRARVSPKPWRIGVKTSIRPRPGVWPVNPGWLPERARWIDTYEQAARNHASCRFVEAVGTGPIHSSAQTVKNLHDELCRANSPMPIA
ncbi:MAG: hypothetical protein PHV34_18905 [Verrucomicrobiae bacterium]|nr:hypothetical protein [Verrucomicrobiae bacterium]